MFCPNCHQQISDRARSCPFCGAAAVQPYRPRRSGGFVSLFLFAVVLTVALRLDGALGSGANAARQTLGYTAGVNPARGTAQQVKEGDLGSAGYLRGDVLLVSLYIDDLNSSWDTEKQANAQNCLTVACEFLEKEAASYDQELNLIYDVAECPNLMYRGTFDGEAADENSNRFTRWLYTWIDKNVPVADLQKEYGTDNVGFLALVADEGGAYTNVYYVEDSRKFFNETSVLFYYYTYVRTSDREVPAVYAHEILHMFGAIDLYEDSPDFSPENIAYVAEVYPDDIMYSEYTDSGKLNYETIHLEVSPVTAYYLGWLDELPEADQEGLSDYERVCVAGFSYDDPTFYDDGGKHETD